jgi:hypothetical protein
MLGNIAGQFIQLVTEAAYLVVTGQQHVQRLFETGAASVADIIQGKHGGWPQAG